MHNPTLVKSQGDTYNAANDKPNLSESVYRATGTMKYK